MDFGLAKLQKSQLRLTSSGPFFGTPLDMRRQARLAAVGPVVAGGELPPRILTDDPVAG